MARRPKALLIFRLDFPRAASIAVEEASEAVEPAFSAAPPGPSGLLPVTAPRSARGNALKEPPHAQTPTHR